MCQFTPSGNGYADEHPGANSVGAEQLFYFMGDHAAWGRVNGRFPYGNADTGQGDCADSFPRQELYTGMSVRVTVERMVRSLVTSGSSPASLVTPQVQLSAEKVHELTGNVTVSPSGRVIVADCWMLCVRSPCRAARVAAVAHEPVVNPLRRG